MYIFREKEPRAFAVSLSKTGPHPETQMPGQRDDTSKKRRPEKKAPSRLGCCIFKKISAVRSIVGVTVR